MKSFLFALILCVLLGGCVGVNQLQKAPPGLHPEDAPTPSGKYLN